jgi:hypothetical protein
MCISKRRGGYVASLGFETAIGKCWQTKSCWSRFSCDRRFSSGSEECPEPAARTQKVNSRSKTFEKSATTALDSFGMRLSPLLRQISASTTRIPKAAPKAAPKTSSSTSTSTSTSIPIQQKLPLPEVFDGHSKNRLRPPKSDFLPSLINAPTSLPPVFIKPEPADTKKWFSTAKDIYYKGKSYFVFYKTGLTQVKDNRYSCRRERGVNRRKIRKVLKAELMRQFKNIHIPGSSNIRICRSEFQMCLRTSRDLKKMPCNSPSLLYPFPI